MCSICSTETKGCKKSYNNRDLMNRELTYGEVQEAKIYPNLNKTRSDELYKEFLATDTQFIKADSGKNRVSLIDPSFILGVGAILTFGAKKYEANNWKQLPPDQIDRYKDSLMRHIYAWLGGELIDPESGLPHLDHIGCNVMFLRHFETKDA